MAVYYNDNNAETCAILGEMMNAGLIGAGRIDGRSVRDVSARDLAGFSRVHLFAGIGGFELAAQLAGWPDGLQLWTGGFPCQPFSCAGRREGITDDRYLWPEFARLIEQGRPEFVLVENVPGIDEPEHMVLDRVCSDLEGFDYEVPPPFEIPACAQDEAHLRYRTWVVAYHNVARRQGSSGLVSPSPRRSTQRSIGNNGDTLAHSDKPRSQRRLGEPGNAQPERQAIERDGCELVGHAAEQCGGEVRAEASREHEWAAGGSGLRAMGDGNGARQLQPGRSLGGLWRRPVHADQAFVRHPIDQRLRRVPVGLLDPAVVLADGLPSRRVALHGLGHAIHPAVAAEILKAMMRAA